MFQLSCSLSVCIDHDAAHKYAEKILVCFGCGWKGEVLENFRVFLRKGSSKNCNIVEKAPPHFPTSNLLGKCGTEIFLFISSVPNFCKCFAFGTILHKNVIALTDVIPISCQ